MHFIFLLSAPNATVCMRPAAKRCFAHSVWQELFVECMDGDADVCVPSCWEPAILSPRLRAVNLPSTNHKTIIFHQTEQFVVVDLCILSVRKVYKRLYLRPWSDIVMSLCCAQVMNTNAGLPVCVCCFCIFFCAVCTNVSQAQRNVEFGRAL